MKADPPVESLVARIESALHKVANHGDKLVKSLSLRCHFWIMADGNERILILFDLEE